MGKSIRIPVEMSDKSLAILSKKEFALYQMLKKSIGTLVTNKSLYSEITDDENHIRVVKRSLQEKIKTYYVISSVYGIGYLMQPVEEKQENQEEQKT
jgi:DNA-binding response OmpR family regulator